MTTVDQDEADRVDAQIAADDTVGFSRAGYDARRRTWDDADMADVAGRSVIVTGGTAGVGRGAAESLARLGAHVVLLSRDATRGATAVEEIRAASGNPRVEWVECDLASLSSVRHAAAEILIKCPRVDVIVNNAGGMWDHRMVSVDGHEMTWATNVLGPFLLTELLTERLAADGGGRIIEMTSGGAYSQKIDLTDLLGAPEDFNPKAVYSRTKRAQIILTEERARQLADRGIVCHVCHPGWTDTPGLRDTAAMASFLARFGDTLRTPEQGADTAVWLASAREPGHCTGLLWHDRRPRGTHRVEETKETAAERATLMATLSRLTRHD